MCELENIALQFACIVNFAQSGLRYMYNNPCTIILHFHERVHVIPSSFKT